jgi:hypothetical protein
MKKLITIAILFVFSFLLAGQFVVYELVLKENKAMMMQSVKSGIHNTQLETISLAIGEANTFIDGNEITWKNKRYDIVWMEQKGNQIIVHALNDALEETLLTALNDDFSGMNRGNAPSPKQNSPLDDFFKEYTHAGSLNLINPSAFNAGLFRAPVSKDKILKGYSHGLVQPPIFIIS